MVVDDATCNECGGTEFTKEFVDRYPDSRRERDQTKKTIYTCDSCGAEARHFEYNNGDGTDTMSGAFR